MSAQDLINKINKQLKSDMLQNGSEDDYNVEVIPTGLLPMDILLDGGVPKGRFSLLYGAFSTAKSLIALLAIKQCQDAGGIAALLDAEKSFETKWAKSLGIDTDNLIVFQPEIGEEGLDFVYALLKSKEVDLIVVDSITALVPEASHDRPLQDHERLGALAALMSRSMKKLTQANHNTAVLWLSQTRTNVGLTFGPNQEASGGKAVGFYCSQIVLMGKHGKETKEYKVHTGEKWETAKETVTQKFKAELTKSKLSKPFKQVYFDWDLTTAEFDTPQFLIGQALDMGLATQSGAWWNYQSVDENGVVKHEVKGQGMGKFKEALVANTEAYAELVQRVCDKHGIANIYNAI